MGLAGVGVLSVLGSFTYTLLAHRLLEKLVGFIFQGISFMLLYFFYHKADCCFTSGD